MENPPDQNRNIRGMDNLVADTTSVSWVDGAAGKLYYRGISIDELAHRSTFEESAYLLLCGRLPTRRQLEAFSWKIHQLTTHVPEKIFRIIQELPRNAHPLDVLQSALASLACVYPEKRLSDESILEKAMRIIAQTPSILAASYRHHLGSPLLRARPDLGFAENFIYMLTGNVPSREHARIMEVALILQMDHGFNPSTFTARTVASTLANMYSATSAAVGALSGPLHGGASELVIEMLEEARLSDDIPQFVRSILQERSRIMGMGHRVYRAVDPRARILEYILEKVTPPEQQDSDLKILRKIAVEATSIFTDAGKPIHVNVDFWTGSIYAHLGLRPILYSGIFAAARVVGWTSHIIELRQDNHLYRPRSLYVGEVDVRYTSIDAR